MQGILRLLMVIVFVELVVCGSWAAQYLGRYEPVLPQVEFDDPLLAADFKALADNARWGNSLDWQNLAEGLLGQGFYGEAELAFRRAVQLDSRNGLAQFGLAYCIDRTGRVQESTAEYLLAADLEFQGDSPIASRSHCMYQVGRNALRAEDPQQAEDIFREHVDYFPAAYQYAKLLVRSGRAEAAMPVIDRVIEAIPRSLKFQALRLHALEDLQRMDEADAASRLLERSEYVVPIDLGATYVSPMYDRLGARREELVCEELWADQQIDAVAKKLNELLNLLEPTSLYLQDTLRMSLIKVERLRKNPDRILELADRLHDHGISNANLLQMEGAAYAMKGEMEKAVPLWLRADRMSPNIPLHHLLAQHFASIEDETQRDRHLGLAALLETKINYWSNQFPEARQAVRKAAKLLPDEATVWYYSAEIERALGQLDQARADYTRCIELSPTYGRAVHGLKTLEAMQSVPQ